MGLPSIVPTITLIPMEDPSAIRLLFYTPVAWNRYAPRYLEIKLADLPETLEGYREDPEEFLKEVLGIDITLIAQTVLPSKRSFAPIGPILADLTIEDLL